MNFWDRLPELLLASAGICLVIYAWLLSSRGSSTGQTGPEDVSTDRDTSSAVADPEDVDPLYHHTRMRDRGDFSRVWDLLQQIGYAAHRFRFEVGVIRLSGGYEARLKKVLPHTREVLEYCGIVSEVVGPWVNDVFLFSGGVSIATILQRLESRLQAMKAYNPPKKGVVAPPALPSTYHEAVKGFPDRVERIQTRWRALVDPCLGPPDPRAGAIRSRFEDGLKFLLSREANYSNPRARAMATKLERWLEELEDKRQTLPLKCAAPRPTQRSVTVLFSRRNVATST